MYVGVLFKKKNMYMYIYYSKPYCNQWFPFSSNMKIRDWTCPEELLLAVIYTGYNML